MSDVMAHYAQGSGGSVTTHLFKASREYNIIDSPLLVKGVDQNNAVTPSGLLATMVERLFAQYAQSAISIAFPPSGLFGEVVSSGSADARAAAKIVLERAQGVMSFEAIYVEVTPWGLECWTIVNNSTPEECRYLYDVEWQLMREMTHVEFRFNLIDREDKPLDALLTLDPSSTVVTYRTNA